MRFFTYETQLPKDVGFSLFGSVHLAWLVGISAFTILAALWFSQRPAYRQRRISWAVAWLLCAMIVVEKVVLALTGHLNVYSLPFHLCELAPLLYLLFAWRHWDWLGQVLYTLCLPGAAAALLFPDWSAYPQWNFMNLNSFLVHGQLSLPERRLPKLPSDLDFGLHRPCVVLAGVRPLGSGGHGGHAPAVGGAKRMMQKATVL